MNSLWAGVAEAISKATGKPYTIQTRESVAGGCINTATVIKDNKGQQYFVKVNDAALSTMFEAEAEGLKEIARTGTVRVPQPICWSEADGSAFLVLEYLDLGSANVRSQETLGRQLAQMHRATNAQFGWRIDNTIGSTPQINTPCRDWVEFWQQRRLGYQLQLTGGRAGKALQQKGEQLLAHIGAFFRDHHPEPSLLHGDLWSGNAAAVDSQPVIFDPAVYYGDREADIAMTELFGGFSKRFYDAYHETWLLDPGYKVRKTLYNLYHVLNHLNLFGGGYASQAEQMIDALLSEIR
jgi:fructosamine-3-kinase